MCIILNMKKLLLSILIIATFTCGCGINKDLSQTTSFIENNQSDETFSQDENQQAANQETSLNNEEPQPQENVQEETLEENSHSIDKAERDCIAKNMTTAGMSNCSYEAMEAWFKEIDKYMLMLKNVTSDEDYKNILEAQTQWKKYQEAEFKAISILINKQGTIYQNILAGKERGLVKQRAHDLKSFYEYLIEK